MRGSRGFGGRGMFGRPVMRPYYRVGPRGRNFFLRPRMRMIPNGMFTLFLLAGTGMAIKLRQDEIRRIEERSGRQINEMTEEELVELMKKLGIENRKLDAEELDLSRKVNKTSIADLELLEKLTQMNYSGMITDEEYRAKKKEILGL